MNRPTRQEQAQAILQRKARRLASQVLGYRATTAADFSQAFNLERVDITSEVPDREALMALGLNRVGPRDGLYVLEEDGEYRVYIQESGESRPEIRGDFATAREAAVDALLLLGSARADALARRLRGALQLGDGLVLGGGGRRPRAGEMPSRGVVRPPSGRKFAWWRST